MQKYFKLLRQVLAENRKKGEGTYYEAHHIVPKSFNKTSSTVILTPEEHYLAHKFLAEYWKGHSVYGNKMLWAYHRISYDKGRKLTKEEYGEARRILQTLWNRPKTVEHKQKLSKALQGNTNNSSRVFKGMKSSISKEGREKLAEARRKYQTGKTGLQAQASKGPYTVEFTNGVKVTEGSYPELSRKTGLKYSTLQYRYVNKRGIFMKGWKIY